jgi:hypothetical protein
MWSFVPMGELIPAGVNDKACRDAVFLFAYAETRGVMGGLYIRLPFVRN